MVANAPIHAFPEFLSPVLTILFSNFWLLSNITIIETSVSGETGMNHNTTIVINPRKEIGGTGERTNDKFCQSCAQPTELPGFAQSNVRALQCLFSCSLFKF